MMEFKSLTVIKQKAESLTRAPENYLCAPDHLPSEIRLLTKELYDFNKINEENDSSEGQKLEELYIDNFDEEQIWQQIELQNNFICQEFVSHIAQFLVKKENLILDHDTKGDHNVDDDGDDDVDDKSDKLENASESDENENHGDTEDGEDHNQSSSEEDSVNGKENQVKDGGREEIKFSKKGSDVDDKFFKLSEMENFLEQEERKKFESDEDNLIDYFEKFSSDSNDEGEGPHYDDFFDQPDDHSPRKKRKNNNSGSIIDVPIKRKKKVKFSLNNNDDCVDDENENNDSSADEDKSLDGFQGDGLKENNEYISTFEARQERLKARIKALEEEALKDKPWQLKGEVTASNRPQNSLLEEYIEFDTAVRPPPVITEKTTLKLEDVIKQRIKDKAWDDVERKIKPVEDPKEYKKRLVLDQEKSKLSLSQIYEQEYLKQKEAKTGTNDDKPEEVPKEHIEISKMMRSLFSKLDALSNFHFTPKMVSTEVKIVSNLPAVTVEEVAPVGTSDATLLAPEEIKSKIKGDLIGKTERTKTDKKRERRLKKKKQKIKQKELEKKEKSKVVKANNFNNNKNKVTKKLIKKLGKNVSLFKENGDGKYVRSSNAFFSRLQDEVRTHIKTKSGVQRKLEKNNDVDIKKLKL